MAIACAELLGIDRNQFSQIVMIAQGDFRRLLKADTKERSAIMCKLFGTQPYLKFQDALAARSHKLEVPLDQLLLEVQAEKRIGLHLGVHVDGHALLAQLSRALPRHDVAVAGGLDVEAVDVGAARAVVLLVKDLLVEVVVVLDHVELHLDDLGGVGALALFAGR